MQPQQEDILILGVNNKWTQRGQQQEFFLFHDSSLKFFVLDSSQKSLSALFSQISDILNYKGPKGATA